MVYYVPSTIYYVLGTQDTRKARLPRNWGRWPVSPNFFNFQFPIHYWIISSKIKC